MFLKITSCCSSVVCCRVTPLQKVMSCHVMTDRLKLWDWSRLLTRDSWHCQLEMEPMTCQWSKRLILESEYLVKKELKLHVPVTILYSNLDILYVNFQRNFLDFLLILRDSFAYMEDTLWFVMRRVSIHLFTKTWHFSLSVFGLHFSVDLLLK